MNEATLRLPVHRRPGLTFYRYVVAEALRPSIFALLGLTVVVLTKDLLGFSDLVVNRGLSGRVVALIAVYKAAPIVTLMFPFSVLLGCLVAIGRMGADREILALEASGVSAARLVWPFVAFAAAMTVVAMALSVAVSPWTNRLLDAAYAEISREKPWAQVQRGTVSQFGGWRLDAREVNARGDEMEGVLLWMPDIGQTIFAQKGAISSGEAGAIEIALESGTVVLSRESGPQSFSFDRLTTGLPESHKLLRDGKEQLRGLRVPELIERARGFVASKGNLLPTAELELHRRFALPFATLVFGLLAVPLFLVRTNFSRAGGGVMGMFCTLSYYGLAQFSQGLAQRGTVGAAAAAWLPNAILGLLAAILIVRARREGVLGHAFDRPQTGEGGSGTRVATSGRRLSRFPLPRYVAARFARMALMSFGILLVGYLLIDIMERLTWFSRYQATGWEVLRFYSARSVLLASRIVPMALLVATALTVSMLAADGELIGMRACGIPAPRALMPVLFIALLVVPADAILNNVLVPRTNALADELKRTEIKDSVSKQIDEFRKASVWYRQGNRVLEAVRFDPKQGTAEDLSVYELGPDRLPISRTDAESARHVGNGWWQLSGASRIDIARDRVVSVAAPKFVEIGEALPAEVDTMHLSIAEVSELIAATESDGIDTRPLRVDFHVKLAQPLACIVLPAVVLFFAVTGPPFPGPAQTLLVSVLVGVGYFLLAGVSRSLGYGGALPAVMGGWGPMVVFGGISGVLGFRIWRRL
jgi:LPS export ABC transporter permease LptG/LPS export ABC transporter permease LptF